ncbi:S-adenosyl-L-methionine-dependent methyltransferase [Mycena albidolilacea]|uniref:S-adenosyl-L-methionine-dependent methyltransferase n=1 Tax=Mycena albidolilacea TaxID=1033008 RepID=A0AAD7AT97_9AGAR|nr:S-adenosyl-L-methionine-dependent methyltransferase [Mycena albidolilacea]
MDLNAVEPGCGSGAWTIQAATQFPAAQILAVDRSPLPNRFLPANISFQIADISKEVDFGDEKFDIVHTRFVLFHIPNAHDVLRRIAQQLVRPGGLLLIEDIDLLSYVGTGPASRHYISMVKQMYDERGIDMEIGRKIPETVRALRDFPNVQFQKISLPFGGNGPDDSLNGLGLAMKQSFVRGGDVVAEVLAPKGFTHEMAVKYREELEKDNESLVDVYFCWASRVG